MADLYRVIAVLEKCEYRLRSLGRTFTGPQFTDRYGDGPICLAIADEAKNLIENLKHVGDSDLIHRIRYHQSEAARLTEEYLGGPMKGITGGPEGWDKK